MSFYTSLTGLNSATAQLAVTSNNIANVGTSGFKRSRADFGDIFSTSPLQKSSSNIGQGVSLKQVSQEFSQGNVSTSGNSLDLAITGDGFFPLQSPDGLQEIYTRNGSFTLNDQNNVVNSTGQRLLAASVDSSGKADLTDMSPLTIPPKTTGQNRPTQEIQLGLNLPAESKVITAPFDRTNPATYGKSTALTVYDAGGNGYLATVYYVKTQAASESTPYSKWQTYFFVGDTQVKPALQQASDKLGNRLYVNKYGETAPGNDSRVVPSAGTTEMYTLDQLTNPTLSAPAAATGAAVSRSGADLALTDATLAPGSATISIDFPVSLEVGASTETVTYALGAGDRYPEVIAKNLQAAINSKLAQYGTDRVTVTAVQGDDDTWTYAIDGTAAPLFADVDIGAAIETAQDEAFASGTPLSFEINVDGANSTQSIIYTLTEADTSPDVLARNLEIAINNQLGGLDSANARYGVRVKFDPGTSKFSFTSGTTGDTSSIKISTTDESTMAYLGLPELDADGEAQAIGDDVSPEDALRGTTSKPAIMYGESMTTTNTSRAIVVGSKNKDFFVSVDGISGRVEVPTGTYSNMDEFVRELQSQINSLVDLETGRKVQGVKVEFDPLNKRLSFTTATTGEKSSIQVSSTDWGLSNTEIQFGQTSEWIKLQQYKENGQLQYVKNGVQTEDSTDLATKTEWWPVYLDRGELTFDTGKLVSPVNGMPFEKAFLDGGKGVLTMSIDFARTTEFDSPFAVLSQSQDGAPEGDLMGLDIGVDGLVSATYSNGSQQSLGKIVLANFSSPTGLRQIGDASYLASATSGTAKIGEAGSAGFGSIRAGATERANVDLTQELVDLITAQRNFQANAKAIETSSTMTQAVINLRA